MKTTFLSAATILLTSSAAYSAPAPQTTPQAPQIIECYGVPQTTPQAPQVVECYGAPATAPQAARSWVSLSAKLDAPRYTPGQPINVTLTATNTSKNVATLNFSSGQRFDFQLFKRGQKDSVYSWSANKLFAQMTGSLTLRPGQKQVFEASIGDEMGQLQAGQYRLAARLTNTGTRIVATPAAFEITSLGLKVSARTDKSAYKVGEKVEVSATSRNLLSRANTQKFNSGLECDFVISDEEGKAIWTYGANIRFVRALGSVTWKPREVRSYSATWHGEPFPSESGPAPLKPGRYKVQAVLQSDPSLASEPVWIDITS